MFAVSELGLEPIDAKAIHASLFDSRGMPALSLHGKQCWRIACTPAAFLLESSKSPVLPPTELRSLSNVSMANSSRSPPLLVPAYRLGDLVMGKVYRDHLRYPHAQLNPWHDQCASYKGSLACE